MATPKRAPDDRIKRFSEKFQKSVSVGDVTSSSVARIKPPPTRMVVPIIFGQLAVSNRARSQQEQVALQQQTMPIRVVKIRRLKTCVLFHLLSVYTDLV